MITKMYREVAICGEVQIYRKYKIVKCTNIQKVRNFKSVPFHKSVLALYNYFHKSAIKINGT